MNDLTKLQENMVNFRDARDWKQFHNPKDLSISLLLEASELLEHFQWKNDKEIKEHLAKHKDEVADELADVFNLVLLIAHDLKIDLETAHSKKMAKNKAKYPINKSKGSHTKYDKL